MASFNEDLLRAYGTLLGKEQRGKGTSVVLAPMMNIARIPRGGRNFESVGEDPFLAEKLVGPYIEGIQSQGLMACAKHWINNEQETERDLGLDSICIKVIVPVPHDTSP